MEPLASIKFIAPIKEATLFEEGLSYSSLGDAICSTLPSNITATLSLIVRASSWSWVTKIKVMPTTLCKWRNSDCICSLNFLSKADNGSSSSKTFGFRISALARATLCFCPPDNALEDLLFNPERPTSSSDLLIISSFSSLDSLFFLKT